MLLLTIFPVLAGLIVSGAYAVTSGFVAAERMLPTWVTQAVLVLLFGFSYLKAGKLAA